MSDSTRTAKDMSSEERKKYAIWQSILDRTTSTEEEKQRARREMEALEFKGVSGPIMKELTGLRDRLNVVEEMGQAMNDDDRKAIKQIRALAARVDSKKLDATNDIIQKMRDGLAELTLMTAQQYGDMQRSWSAHEAKLVEMRREGAAQTARIESLQETINNKFRAVESEIAQVRRDLNTLVTDAVNEAKTAIESEAVAAATRAVADLIGGTS